MGGRCRYTPEQDEWICTNFYTADSYADLANQFNKKFGDSRTKDAMHGRARQLGLKGMCEKHFFTSWQDEWLRNNYDRICFYDELVDQFNLYFGTSRTVVQIQARCNKGLGLKGKPGRSSYKYKDTPQLPVDTIRKTSNATYIKVCERPGDPVKVDQYRYGYCEPYWLPLQKKIYQDAHGEIEPDQIVCFLDGNHENFDLGNLYCIDRRISAIMSKNKWWTHSREHTLTAIKWCELHYAIRDQR